MITCLSILIPRGPFSLLRLIWGNGGKLAAKLERSCFQTERPSELLPLSRIYPIIKPATLRMHYLCNWYLLPHIFIKNKSINCEVYKCSWTQLGTLNGNGHFRMRSYGFDHFIHLFILENIRLRTMSYVFLLVSDQCSCHYLGLNKQTQV